MLIAPFLIGLLERPRSSTASGWLRFAGPVNSFGLKAKMSLAGATDLESLGHALSRWDWYRLRGEAGVDNWLSYVLVGASVCGAGKKERPGGHRVR
ncbi:hypothetical protein BJ508DRAFT_117842 [Ascobolus immersus RN42]|uniref:Uncharacterized protein n=1 Tax=Ascobolus immersus RN42 TaxID=1160509 RepID=A0A3N4IA30_ASCIM|nr:hypothetical protein BJ508DRAFT_117842 [Ascobolus immersus RN42]